MTDLSEDVLAPDVVVRRAPTTEIRIRDGEVPLVGVSDGAVWARAEPGSAGLDVSHGAVDVVVRAGTVLLDAHGGAGLVIAVRGEAEISSGGEVVRRAPAGHAVTFDGTGHVGDSDPVDATELARDPFISLNLVLDALADVPVAVDGPEATPALPPSPDPTGAAGDGPAPTDPETDGEGRRSRGFFGSGRNRP